MVAEVRKQSRQKVGPAKNGPGKKWAEVTDRRESSGTTVAI